MMVLITIIIWNGTEDGLETSFCRAAQPEIGLRGTELNNFIAHLSLFRDSESIDLLMMLVVPKDVDGLLLMVLMLLTLVLLLLLRRMRRCLGLEEGGEDERGLAVVMRELILLAEVPLGLLLTSERNMEATKVVKCLSSCGQVSRPMSWDMVRFVGVGLWQG